MNERRLNKLVAISLSDADLLELVDHRASILTYSELRDYDTIDEVLGSYQACFLLYETAENFGHWTLLFRNGHKVFFFDPYGDMLGKQLSWTPDDYREVSGQNYPTLTALLYESPYKIYYNEIKYQKHGRGISSCGRWCALRLVCRDMDPNKFKKLFYGKNADKIVTLLTTRDLDY